MDKTKIVCIVGESGSGKTTIAELLEKEGYRNINSFTTRKPRYEGETGHLFTNLKQYECNKATNSIVAETFFDGNYYWTTKGQFNGTCIYVVDVAGVRDLKKRFKDDELLVIYLKADEKERHIRLWDRYFEQSGETYMNDETLKGPLQQTDERIKHDKNVFKVIPCDYVIDANRDIKEVLEDVRSVI